MKYKLIKCYPGFNQLGIIHSSENKNPEWQGTYYYDKYPEHWEKVVDKTYKILKSCPIKGTIYKVKRLSDDVVFIVGDKIKRIGYNDVNSIRGFNEDKNGYILVSISDEIDKGYFDKKGVNISAIDHAKNVLFTTLDGVDIFEGDICYAVSDNFNVLYTSHVPDDYQKQGVVRCFSTKEKAEEYVIMNKPCLSLKEVLEIVTFLDRSEKILKELVKSKL